VRDAPRDFGATLIILAVILLNAGLWSHYRELAALRVRRAFLHDEGRCAPRRSSGRPPPAPMRWCCLC
jgi:hypothetical protein